MRRRQSKEAPAAARALTSHQRHGAVQQRPRHLLEIAGAGADDQLDEVGLEELGAVELRQVGLQGAGGARARASSLAMQPPTLPAATGVLGRA